MPVLNLLDMAKRSGNDKAIGLIEENLNAAPELSVIPMFDVAGTSFKTLVRTAFPANAGKFRGANEGVASSKSDYKQVLHECYISDTRIEMDAAVAEADENGPAAALGDEASGAVAGALLYLGKQVYAGTVNDAKGFPGLKAFLPKGGTTSLDAGGTTAGTASSAYLVRLGRQHVSFRMGMGGALKFPPFKLESVVKDSSDPANIKYMQAFVSHMQMWMGLVIGNVYSCARILNLTSDSGKGLTDKLVAKLVSQLPRAAIANKKEWRLFINQRDSFELQSSRSTVNAVGNKTPSGVENWAPPPEESNGIQIVVTDSIPSNDTLE